jgi:NAD+-dependent protein deacetylase SIR2
VSPKLAPATPCLYSPVNSTFYHLAGDILPDLHRWTPTHQFIKLLQDKGKLLRNYTQNIDNVESHAGIQKEKMIQCHGSWATATCRKCGFNVPGEDIFDSVKAKEVAKCKRCIASLAAPKPQGMKRKRSANGSSKPRKRSGGDSDDDSEYDIPEPGVMKPDITFFGEKLPDAFFNTIQTDRDVVDLVIVMGTSMKVAPVSEIPGFVPSTIPQIYISRDPIYHINFDVNLLGDCDTVVAELCRRAGWELKHEMVPEDQKTEVQPHEEGDGHIWSVRPVSALSGSTAGAATKPEPEKSEPTVTTITAAATKTTSETSTAYAVKNEVVSLKSELTVATV